MAKPKNRKNKRAATEELERPGNKQRKQLSTEVRRLRSNAGLRARLHAEEAAEAREV